MKHKFTPELQQIQDEFVENLSVGGIEAVKPILTRLAIEKSMLEVYHYHFVKMEHEDEDLLRVSSFPDLIGYMDILDFADTVAEDYEHAVARQELATQMLETLLDERE